MQHRILTTAAGIAAAIAMLSACSGETSSQEQEAKAKQKGYDKLVANQPAETMSYSPTRETINRWVDTWDEKGKLSYVYLQNPDGAVIGYYVLTGLPVSYCAQGTPPTKIHDDYDWGTNVPAPATDGAYYPQGGGSCDTYYGFDATTGAYIEYTAGLGINVLLYDQPLDRPGFNDADALGATQISDVPDGGDN